MGGRTFDARRWLAAMAVCVWMMAACAEPRDLDHALAAGAVGLDVVVCLPGAPSGCEAETYTTVCDDEVIAVAYRACFQPIDSGRATIRYLADRDEWPDVCDIEGRMTATWEALARGLSQKGECE